MHVLHHSIRSVLLRDCFVPRNDKFFIKYNYLLITTAALQPPKPEAVLRKLPALMRIGETHTFTRLVTPNSSNPGVEIIKPSFNDWMEVLLISFLESRKDRAKYATYSSVLTPLIAAASWVHSH